MKKRVVVIGGGFAGSYAAKELDKYFEVTLIDSKEYFEFTPGVLRTIVEPEHVRKIQVLHSHYLKFARVLVGKVMEVSKNYVLFENRKIKFDYLVIASGSSYNLPFKEQKVVVTTRAKHLRNYYNKLCRAEKILIIGGGIVGVELAGEILWRYKNKKIIIVHAKGRLIERNSIRAVNYTTKFLRGRGVEIVYNERVVEHKGGSYITDAGRVIKTDIAFLCTGITSNYAFMKKNFPLTLNEKNQIKVNNYLQLTGCDNIFVAGDVNNCDEEKTAQNAERQARIVVKNICVLDKGGKLHEYKTKVTPLVISLGKYNGIFSGEGFVFAGIVPALMKSLIEKWEMWKKRRVM